MLDFSDLLIFRFQDVIDIIVVACLVYGLAHLIKDTRAELLIKGIAILIIIQQISQITGLYTVTYILQGTMQVGIVAIVVVFQPELRRGLERMGSSRFGRFFMMDPTLGTESAKTTVSGICEAVNFLSQHRIGSLIVMERRNKIGDIIRTGVMMNSLVSSELLVNIFSQNTPLHDGAVVIRDNRIMAAACLLPLTSNQNLSTELGTRHRAALGISETSDSVVVVTSEETGTISIAINGALTRNLTISSLEKALLRIVNVRQDNEEKPASRFLWKGRNDK
ncbi:MAG: diadenylate cyclase CdaA [Clostridiales bacterium]|jgi:diadenylate cyclase|nr:diadenylate cyclase CdaA [Clostridiales bacterium]